MPTYYIDKCEPAGEFTNKYGNIMAKYNLLVKNQDGTWEAQILQRPDTPAPSGNIEGTIQATQYGNRFTKTKAAGQAEFSSGRSPEEKKSIVRQHSQQMAIMWAAILDKHNQLPTDESNHIEKNWLANCINYFQMDAENAGES